MGLWTVQSLRSGGRMGKKLVVRLARGAQEGLRWGLVMNYGRSPAPPVGGQHLYHAMGIVQVGGAAVIQ